MSYTNYVVGVPAASGANTGGAYNFLVSGGNDYTGASGMMIKNDTTQSAAGNKGTRIFQDSSDNAYYDFRTNATDGAQNLAFRLQDDSTPTSFSNMLVLNKDITASNTNVYGATVGGRVKASQFYVGQNDTRAPMTAGVYMGFDSNTTGYFRVNKGTGTGGFTFNTYNANGSLAQTNMNMNAVGTVQIPAYQNSGATQDSETTAFATFDATGNLVRDYSQNQRIRSIETRVAVLESETVASVPEKVNEVIGRINSLNFFSSPIANLVIPGPAVPVQPQPGGITPQPNIVSAQVSLMVTTAAKNAALSTTIFKTTIAANVNSTLGLLGAAGLTASRIVAFSIATTSSYTENGFPTYPPNATQPAADGGKSMYLLTFTINPDPAQVSQVGPILAAQTIINNSASFSTAQGLNTTNSLNKALMAAFGTAYDVLDIYYQGTYTNVAYNASA
jgi:hypothetical protein